MIPTQSQQQAAVGSTIEQWSAYLQDLHDRIRHRFRRPELRERLWRYLLGLIGDARRKNGWQMAEAIGETQPRSTQRILGSSRWDADAVRDDLRGYVAKHLGDEQSGVLIVDETGFLKKGNKSVGVGRRYTGTAGKKENCQIGVFLAYASQKGSALWIGSCICPTSGPTMSTGGPRPGVPRKCASPSKGGLPGSC